MNLENILEEFDITYKDSNMIKSLKTSPKGFYSCSKILNEKELDLLEQIVSKKIEEAEKNIKAFKKELLERYKLSKNENRIFIGSAKAYLEK